jgi:hypothetical protein
MSLMYVESRQGQCPKGIEPSVPFELNTKTTIGSNRGPAYGGLERPPFEPDTVA